MAQGISLNQFKPNNPIAGMYVYQANLPQLHNIIVSATQTTALTAGAFVAIDTASTNKNAAVVKQAATTDNVFGVITFTPVQNQFGAGERIAIARTNDIVFLPAAGAITAGALLTFNTSNKVTTAAAGNVVVGRAITPASAADELIQVELQFHAPSSIAAAPAPSSN